MEFPKSTCPTLSDTLLFAVHFHLILLLLHLHSSSLVTWKLNLDLLNLTSIFVDVIFCELHCIFVLLVVLLYFCYSLFNSCCNLGSSLSVASSCLVSSLCSYPSFPLVKCLWPWSNISGKNLVSYNGCLLVTMIHGYLFAC